MGMLSLLRLMVRVGPATFILFIHSSFRDSYASSSQERKFIPTRSLGFSESNSMGLYVASTDPSIPIITRSRIAREITRNSRRNMF